ncbi:MAG: hypothetical protein ACLFM1_08580 [Bacteroidales bacterium]
MQKEKYKIQAKKTIDEIFNQIEELERKQKNVSDKTRAKYERQIAELKSKTADLKENYKKMETERDEKWHKAKRKFSESAEYIKEGLNKLSEI